MRRYIIERSIPGVGGLNSAQLCQAATTSNAALAQLGKDVQWVESYVTGDQTYCVYLAKDEAVIRKHAELSGFPANRIVEVKGIISPTTASAH